MARRPKLLLLDAGAVFGALEHDAWDVLTDCYKVVVPTIVLEEVQFYVSRETGRRVDVDPGEWVSARRIERYEASAADLASTLSVINVPDGPEIHEGEAEALTYLRTEMRASATDVAFVSADGAAIQATALLDLSHTARCLAEVLQAVGYSKPLAARYQRQFVDEHLQKGFERRLGRPSPPT
jgi:hypothetical protein